MPHRELVPLFFPGLRPTPSGGIAPKSKKRVGRWGTERGAHAGSPRGVRVHHLTSGGTAVAQEQHFAHKQEVRA
jgi:hypothetical protein